MKPVLLLDVDGVLAPFGCHQGPPQDYDFIEISGGALLWGLNHPETMQRLIQVCSLGWATAWEEKANEELLEHLGLEDHLPFINFWERVSDDLDMDTWKLPWIEHWTRQNPDTPLIWIDDEIKADALEFADNREVPTLFLRTDPSKGLTPEHVDQVEQWVSRLTAV